MASGSTNSPSGIVPLRRELSFSEAISHHAQMVYTSTTAQGNSRNHYGNSYHTYNGSVYHQSGSDNPNRTTDVQDQQAQDALDMAKLREALAFDTMDDRYYDIRTAHGQTCQWFFKSSEYRHWRDLASRSDHHGILWVKGKPGAGKSTLMKCAYTHGSMAKDEVTIAFFFNARGEELQKSDVGLYRSLLNQLLDQLLSRIPHLSTTLLALPSRRRRLNRRDWPIELLKDLFSDIILALGSIRLTCYIDALDECPETSIRDMLDFLEDLGTSTLKADIVFSVMLSSRHYPNITVRHASILILEGREDHHQDIAEYVHDKLRIDDSALARDLASEIKSRSSGVFLWVVLVVAILNKMHDRGNRHQLLASLRKLPDELHSLFQQIIQDSRDRAGMVDLFLWILYAQGPLELEECYHAVVISQQGYSIDGWDPSGASTHDMTRFIIDTSRGLAEMAKGSHPNVQFIHESVRDFLFADGLGLLEPGLARGNESNASVIHERLYQCCRRHVLLYASLESFLLTDKVEDWMPPKYAHGLATANRLCNKYPFLYYALKGLLYHAESMLRLGQDDLEHARVYLHESWIRLRNLIIDPDDRFGINVSREYVFATERCYHLLEEATRDESQVGCWDRRMIGERHTCLLAVALHDHDQKMIDMLKRHGATEG
jgi:hypothetical protein